MNTLGVWTYTTPDGADDALRTLEKLQTLRQIVIDDASVVAWPVEHRKPCSYQACSMSGGGSLSGAFWGLLFSQLFLLPLVGDAGSTAGLGHLGLADDFLADVRRRSTPGTSTLFLLTQDEELDRIRGVLTADPGPALVITFDREQELALRHAFADDDDETTGRNR